MFRVWPGKSNRCVKGMRSKMNDFGKFKMIHLEVRAIIMEHTFPSVGSGFGRFGREYSWTTGASEASCALELNSLCDLLMSARQSEMSYRFRLGDPLCSRSASSSSSEKSPASFSSSTGMARAVAGFRGFKNSRSVTSGSSSSWSSSSSRMRLSFLEGVPSVVMSVRQSRPTWFYAKIDVAQLFRASLGHHRHISNHRQFVHQWGIRGECAAALGLTQF